MRTRLAGTLVFAAAWLSACQESPVESVQAPDAPTPAADTTAQTVAGPEGVATFGTVLEVRGSTLVLEQQALRFSPGPDVAVGSVEHELPIGSAGNRLEVTTDASLEVVLGGEQTNLAPLTPGTPVIVTGTQVDGGLRAIMVSDLSTVAPPPEDLSSLVGTSLDRTQSSSPQVITPSAAAADETSLCLGQDMDYDADPDVLEFQGCWGGPTATDDVDAPDIPFACPLVGCFVIDRFSYTMALGGWSFAFPYRFSASSSGLVYHIPGEVSLNMDALGATTGSFTFAGGLGVDFGINVDFCTITGCSDVGTFHINQFSMVHQATEEAPFPGETMEIEEVACPSIGVIGIPGVADLLSIALCEDLNLIGAPFSSDVDADGSSPFAFDRFDFAGSAQTLTVRPDALTVDVTYDIFEYIPDLEMGVFFRICGIECIVTIWDTPTIHLTSGPFEAVTTPFPLPGSVFTVATDPNSPAADPEYLYQPTRIGFTFDVAPAPTVLTIISSNTLAETEAAEALLQEAYDGSPIAGETVVFDLGAQSVSAVTDAAGIARVTLPIGEHSLTARFDGSPYYEPSSDQQSPVFVYRPTQFVIWGGNAGGIQMEERYQFWGSDWWKQVTGGDFDADASFKGYATQLTEMGWENPPANAVRPPATLPSHIGVIVSTRISGAGRYVTGNIAGLVVLEVEDPASYRPNPGHAAWGVMKLPITPSAALASN